MSDGDTADDGVPAVPTLAELRHLAEMLSTPIDFDLLVADGILKKRGAWWQVLDRDRLPEHARHKDQNLKTGNCVQFCKHDPSLRDRLG